MTTNEVKRIGTLTKTWNSDMYEHAELIDAMQRRHEKIKKSIVKAKARIIRLEEAMQWQDARIGSVETKLTQHTIAIRRFINDQQQLASQNSCTTTEDGFDNSIRDMGNES